uniref:Signal transducing adapter molecule 1 n=1 Tax=Cacopsylla melanoneura TaxID=428564 RepID=A0A8D9EY42_9HEMI
MGLFGSSSPFDPDVEKATSENITSEDWNLIIEICDKVGTSSQNAKDCLKSITKRLNHADPHVVLLAITLLEACVKNCGTAFLLEVASRDFELELSKLLKQKQQPKISEKLKLLLKSWAEDEFNNDPQLGLIPSLYQKLKQEGMDFNIQPDASTRGKKDSRAADTSRKEEDDLKKAIELSLKESSKQSSTRSHSNAATSSNLYPSANNFVKPVHQPPPVLRKVKALYDFEAAEDNELTFYAGEIFEVTDDVNPNWWKGQNERGEGLFPANFVTSDLTAELESTAISKSNKKIAFDENVSVAVYKTNGEHNDHSAIIEIDEVKIDRLLHLLHEADPEDASHDTGEMLELEEQVNGMGPLIDTELETVDKEHAQLTQLSSQLVEALNLYHTLMKEPPFPNPGQIKPGYPGANYQQPMSPPVNMYNGMGPPHTQQYHGAPPQYMPQYNMGAQNMQYPPQMAPNSMGPMYSGMQPGPPPPHHYQGQQPPPLQQAPQHPMPPHQMLPPSQPGPGNALPHLQSQHHSLPPQGGPVPTPGGHQMPSHGQHNMSNNMGPPPGQGHPLPNQLPQHLPPSQPGMGGMMPPQHHMGHPAQYPGPPMQPQL